MSILWRVTSLSLRYFIGFAVRSKWLACCIWNQLIDLGYCNCGVMEHPTFSKLRNTNMTAVLVEVGFIDSDDVGVLTLHGDEIARALARGVTDYWKTI